ncbi:MAG: hypothetical protein LBQ65_03925 [Tannerellaceae bacterium]|jgi:hypothetical protein|nr:hypothetical protein [Tannerellaceae bacterium]
MKTIRKIMDADQLLSVMDIPQQFYSSKVEVTIRPLPKPEAPLRKNESMMGFLKDYANPALVEQEKNAWELHLKEKYGTP